MSEKFVSALINRVDNVLEECKQDYSKELSSYGSALAMTKEMFINTERSVEKMTNFEMMQFVLDDLSTVRKAYGEFKVYDSRNVAIEGVIRLFNDLNDKYPNMPSKCAGVFKDALYGLSNHEHENVEDEHVIEVEVV